MRTTSGVLTAVAVSLAASLSARAGAEQAPPHAASDGENAAGPKLELTLAAALSMAARRAPELGPARASRAGAEEVVARSRAWVTRPPELGVAAGARFGADHGFDATVSLLQPLSLGGVSGARQRLAGARRTAAEAALLDVRTRTLLATAAAWVDARLTRELARVREESLREAQALLELAEARLRTGAATAGERSLARALVGSARAAVLDAEGRRFAADAELGFEVGRRGEELEVSGALDADGPDIAEADVLAATERHPRLQHLRQEARAAEAGVEQMRAEGTPYLTVGPSFAHEGTGDFVLLGHVAVPLPFVNPNAFEAAERARLARIARADAERERERLRTDALVALHERAHARLARDALARDALTPAREGLDEATARYREGKAPLGDVLVARRAFLEIEERHLEASAAARVAELKLSWVLGRLVVEAP